MPKPIRIAIDPGGSTGVSVRLDDGDFMTATFSDYGEGHGFEFYKFLRGNVKDKDQIVICERFYGGGRIGQPGESTLQLIGAIKMFCFLAQVDLIMRTPQSRLSFITPSRKELQKKRLPFTEHEMDSHAHLLSYEYELAHKK
mgnify:CR=1 FL=1